VHRALEQRVTSLLDRVLVRSAISEAVGDYEESVDPDANPADMLVYVKGVIVAWYALAIFFGLLMVALAYAGDQLDATPGRDLGLAIGLGLSLLLRHRRTGCHLSVLLRIRGTPLFPARRTNERALQARHEACATSQRQPHPAGSDWHPHRPDRDQQTLTLSPLARGTLLNTRAGDY
jgi:hypothetical protein